MGCLLEVRDLHVSYRSLQESENRALSGVHFSIEAGEILGVLGESASGKSSLAAAILRLLPPNGRILRGSVLFEGLDLLAVGEDELRRIRGARIALIYQEPGLALHPAMRVRDSSCGVGSARRPGTRTRRGGAPRPGSCRAAS